MKTSFDQITDWHGWRDKFLQDATAAGWTKFMTLPADAQIPPWQWAAMFPLVLQNDLTNAMLLACLQLPQAEAEAALASIVRKIHALRFDKPPRQMKRDLKELYRESTKFLLRDLPSEADFCQALFLHYLHDDYAMDGNVNLLMREAQSLATMRQRERALEQAARAGAAALRGQHIWPGWADEGSPEFRHWALALTGIVEALEGFGLVPMGSIAEERTRMAERGGMLRVESSPARSAPAPELLTEVSLSEPFMQEWMELANRDEPLSDQEIKSLGARYEQFAEAAMRTLEMSAHVPPHLPIDVVVGLSVSTIGMLRYADQLAIDKLIEVIRDQAETYSDKTISNAVWALVQLGDAALRDCFDFVRYSSDDDARDDMLEVLGEVGRGHSEIFDYLSQQLLESSWENGKSRFAQPLALLHDARAVPMLADALSDPAADEDDAWELLDALEELGVAFEVDELKRSITIPDYGSIENVLPEGWVSRAEQEAVAQAVESVMPPEWEDTKEGGDLDVVYDEHGIAHCPDCGEQMEWIDGGWAHPPIDDEVDSEVEFDAQGLPHCPDCGALMKKVGGRWVHSTDALSLAPQKPIRVEKIGRNDPCPCGSGKKYKNCHGKPGAAALN